MVYTDFDKITLNSRERLLLRLRSNGKQFKRKEAKVMHLCSCGLASPVIIGYDSDGFPIRKSSYEINDKGKRYVVYLNNELWRFLRRSVLVPIIVALVTSFLYNILIK